jgi:hypothetical protein
MISGVLMETLKNETHYSELPQKSAETLLKINPDNLITCLE